MPKRFTDTEKWKKPFIRQLNAAYKLLWLYVCDDCDHAGIWQVDLEVAEIRIGEKLTLKEALIAFQDKVIEIDNGAKWFIPSFLEFQYPTGLNPDNKAHAGICKILEKYNLVDDNFKPLASPLNGAKDMDKEKDMDMDKVKEMDKDIKWANEKIVQIPFHSDSFTTYWAFWKGYKAKEHKFKYKTPQSEQASLNELVKLSNGDESIALKIIEQSMSNGWKGFFPLKNNETYGNTKTHQTRVSHITDQQLHESLAKRFGSR